MAKTRDSSTTLCKGLVYNLLRKNNNIKNISIDILDVSDQKASIKILIDGKIKKVDVILEKPKRKINIDSMKNLKNQKINIENKELDLNILKKDNVINKEIIDLEINKSNYLTDNVKTHIEDDIEKENNFLDIIQNVKIENNNNKEIIVCKENMENKEIYSDSILKTNIDECISNIENKENDNLEEDSEEEEPEDIHNYRDPYYTKYPDEFICEDCYETNKNASELFNFAQKKIDENNELIDKNNKLEKEILKIKEILNTNPKRCVSEIADNYIGGFREYVDKNVEVFCNLIASKRIFYKEFENIIKNKNKINNVELKNIIKIYKKYINEVEVQEKKYENANEVFDVYKETRKIVTPLIAKDDIIKQIENEI